MLFWSTTALKASFLFLFDGAFHLAPFGERISPLPPCDVSLFYHTIREIEDAVWVSPHRMIGITFVRGNSVSVYQFFKSLVDGVPLQELLETFGIDKDAAKTALLTTGDMLSEAVRATSLPNTSTIRKAVPYRRCARASAALLRQN